MSYLPENIIWIGGNFSQHMKNLHEFSKDEIALFKFDSYQLEFKYSVAIQDDHIKTKAEYDKKILFGLAQSERTKQQWIKYKNDPTIKRIKVINKPDKIECIHCNKKCSPANHYRWHGDNCKFAKASPLS